MLLQIRPETLTGRWSSVSSALCYRATSSTSRRQAIQNTTTCTAQKLHEAHRVKRVVRLGSTQSVPNWNSVVLLDFDVIMNCLDVFGGTRNGRGLVCRFPGPGTAGQPYDSILAVSGAGSKPHRLVKALATG
jgi:hypothetical protein